MDIKKAAVGFVALAIVIVITVFLLAAALLMVLVNIPLQQYGVEPLSYYSAMAITALLSVFGGFIGATGSNKS